MKTEPRMSINKLMEFMSEPLPSRRRELVDNQKNPLANKPKITWCASARRAIVEFFASGCSDESILDNEIERLQHSIETLDEKDPKKLESKTKKLQVEIDAINSFKGLHKEMDFMGFKFVKVSKKPKYLEYSGVHVSVRPEVIVSTQNLFEHVGCLKLYFTKNRRLKQEEADFLCSILNHYTETHLSLNHSANPKACFAIDIFGRKVFTASKNVSFHTGRIRKSCQEIREIWKDVPNRNEINGDGQDEMNF